MALSYAFGGNTGQSYDELQRRRMFAESLMQRGMSSQPKTAIEGLNSAASSIMGALLQKKLGAQDAANRQKATQAALDIFGRPAPDVIPPNPGVSTPRNPNDPVQIGNDTMAALGKTPNGWDGIKAGIFAGESGGDYNALFGFQNRPGGAFSNVQLTGMSVDDALKFADPNGQYGQHVKGQIGRVATPMGAYQVVGTTLAAAKKGLGLRGDEIMTPDLAFDMLPILPIRVCEFQRVINRHSSQLNIAESAAGAILEAEQRVIVPAAFAGKDTGLDTVPPVWSFPERSHCVISDLHRIVRVARRGNAGIWRDYIRGGPAEYVERRLRSLLPVSSILRAKFLLEKRTHD
jgi:hypothetical protein